ncbi:GNAT family N-acetyltransferase [Aureibaculum sp. 2210JD6-5]|uniref:GNAT family N-acetyltransferase n=1 Tax=Aureibaculum sp. 2210JD6-5 TaxID=3103957 RepID=UPI002AAC88D7|nr:GNAT family N-acetyltransferase [Aureibaculum sp. 2210JD6-5]MDY7395763.1 GNAT family N-acetyltransferase [Aureibaculum sp. 2210JD6-5]
MKFTLKLAHVVKINKAFDLLKSASKTLAEKNIKQWDYWQNPPIEKVNWVKEGFSNNEFYFIENDNKELMGMVRIMDKDLTYWGAMNDKAKYVHSLVISEKFSGNRLGTEVVKKIEKDAKKDNYDYLRLDCDSTNLKLCQYYEQQGFVKVGQKKLPLGVYNLYQKELI